MSTENSTPSSDLSTIVSDLAPKVILGIITIIGISIARAIDRSGVIEQFEIGSSGCKVKFK